MASKSKITYRTNQVAALAKRLLDASDDVRPGTPESDHLLSVLMAAEGKMTEYVAEAAALVPASRNR